MIAYLSCELGMTNIAMNGRLCTCGMENERLKKE